ncbi:hypothetical protein NCCP1664_01850 [Zafaria cholistanensis]|uniref:Uncharacterized protein n=1 Tax=Zafaria cholistanensis TaxID=1682741 RepID=A0A5A7NPI3_9MICC|nr:hypothetical protein [Zafaria cholistanensis]GER21688.1 hypothetical protein NCCP1664_01850 [Zafaria cholistanensis]
MTALTNAQPIGPRIYVANMRRVTVEYNPTSEFMKFPGQTYVDGTLYIGSSLDTQLTCIAAGVLGVASNQAIRTGRGSVR